MEISISTISQICLGILCFAVMVQCVRLDRALKGINSPQMSANVKALDASTDRARAVLTELKRTLSTDGVACAKAVTDAKEASDELALMVKIGSTMADRLVQAAEAAPKAAAEPPAEKKAPAKKKAAAKTASTRKKPAAKKPAAKKPAAKKAAPKKAAAKKPAAPRRKASTKVADATAKDIKVPTKPLPGQRTLRLVGKDETAEEQAAAA
ncbi:DUF6468 domain-containing protein [Erythrobacter aureus]|uniref:DUF6468 domain-containing protein n=1 Tax=Erythrobacter aureus TaxID=2182384 RepID=UPI0015B2258B|nr:DUF6468 domain-containing protein [Erythrobacter aureus]